ncbi:hypothetical protein DFJ63DRAFT_334042 [Scheffersomyces coipomensis]|uniref:uncharacterized protein n=1 Tax=Scheffersomyces coipomensis TaxID=1788519 RepID=UPI00315D6FDD
MASPLQSGSAYVAGNADYPNFSCGATMGEFPDVDYDTMVNVYLCGILEGRYWAQDLFTGKTSKQKSTATQTSGQSSLGSSTTTEILETNSQGTLTSTAQFPEYTLAPGQFEALNFRCGPNFGYGGMSVDNTTISNTYYCGISEGQYEILGYVPNHVSNATKNMSNISKFAWVLIFASILYSIVSIPI